MKLIYNGSSVFLQYNQSILGKRLVEIIDLSQFLVPYGEKLRAYYGYQWFGVHVQFQVHMAFIIFMSMIFANYGFDLELTSRGVIGNVRCGFLQIYAFTPYSAVFLLYTPMKIGFSAVRFGVVLCRCGFAVWARLIWVRLGQSKCQFESKKSTFTTTQKFG